MTSAKRLSGRGDNDTVVFAWIAMMPSSDVPIMMSSTGALGLESQPIGLCASCVKPKVQRTLRDHPRGDERAELPLKLEASICRRAARSGLGRARTGDGTFRQAQKPPAGIGEAQARPTQPSAGSAELGFAQANGRFDEERL